MRVILDTAMLREKDSAHAYLKEKLSFPAYYGNNLDALHDCLTEMAPVTIIADFCMESDTYAAKIVRVINRCKEDGVTLISWKEALAEYDELKNNIVDMIKEEQIKLGYSSETVHLYYPLETLNRFLNAQLTSQEMIERIQEFSILTEDLLGKVTVSAKEQGTRFCISIPPEGGARIHDLLDENEFLVKLIQTISKHECSMDEIEAVFRRYSDQVIVEKMTDEDFDYLIYFENGIPDQYRYCFTCESCHIIYHRFTRADYEALYMK